MNPALGQGVKMTQEGLEVKLEHRTHGARHSWYQGLYSTYKFAERFHGVKDSVHTLLTWSFCIFQDLTREIL